MTHSDRTWTAVIAECGLDRARPVLAALCPEPFARVDLAAAVAATGLTPDRTTTGLRLALETALGDDAPAALNALSRLPFDPAQTPATTFWRVLFRDLHGRHQPDLPGEAGRTWAAFITAYRGRNNALDQVPDWLAPVVQASQAHRALADLARAQRALPLTRRDRSTYVRFGWNDDGDVPGMTGLLDAAALLRTQAAWTLAAPLFDATAQAAIQSTAADVIEVLRKGAMATLDEDAKRYGVTPEKLAAALYSIRPVPPLADILTEAA